LSRFVGPVLVDFGVVRGVVLDHSNPPVWLCPIPQVILTKWTGSDPSILAICSVHMPNLEREADAHDADS
jgi:hypothetical protein